MTGRLRPICGRPTRGGQWCRRRVRFPGAPCGARHHALARGGEADLVRDACCPVGILAAMARWGEPATRRPVAANPGTPWAILRGLSGDADLGVRLALASRESDPVVRFDETDRLVLVALAANPATSWNWLRRLLSSPVTAVRAALGANPAIGEEGHLRLASDRRAAVRAGAARWVRDPGAQDRLARDDARVRVGLAANPFLDPGVMAQLAGDPSVEVRQALAQNTG